MMRMPSDIYDLDVIDQAYGKDADLYEDVLKVSYLASDAEIQSAFFDRRSEIFTVLSKLNQDNDETDDDDEIALSQRRFAERRMDAVVVGFRILKDPDLRGMYEGDRERRISRRKDAPRERDPSQDELSSPRGVSSFDDSVRTAPFDEQKSTRSTSSRNKKREVKVSIKVESPPRTRRTLPSRKSKTSRNAPKDSEQTPQETSEEENEVEADENRNTSDAEDSESVVDIPRNKNPEGVLAKIRESTIVKSISEEIHGAYLDTSSAFDQVFNAFTLQDSEIDAVCGRIDKAKKQPIFW